MTQAKSGKQSGGTFLGFIAGLVCGLAVAVAVAIFITKAPIPFVDRTGNKGVDAQPITGVQLPDPNKPFYSKDAPGTHPPASAAGGTAAPGTAAPPAAPVATAPNASAPAAAAPATSAAVTASPKNTAASPAAPAAAPAAPSATTTAPADKKLSLFDVAPSAPTPAKSDPAGDDGKARYLLQAGAFKTESDAEAMRAKLTLLGMEAKVSMGEKDGATLYRVRIGPIGKLDELNRTRQTLVQNGIEPSIISVK